MNLYLLNNIPEVKVKKFVIIFYCIGFLGFLIPFSRNIFITITPFAILLSIYLLAAFHNFYYKRDVITFSLIYLLGFIIEAIGVSTGLVFGNYTYGNALGIKLFETPLLIGFNWLFMAYTCSSVSEKITQKVWLQLVISATLMLIYDLVLEQLAPKMDMWYWQNNIIAIKNYIVWWITGLAFTGILRISKTCTKNPLSLIILSCQFLFFMVLFLFYQFIND